MSLVLDGWSEERLLGMDLESFNDLYFLNHQEKAVKDLERMSFLRTVIHGELKDVNKLQKVLKKQANSKPKGADEFLRSIGQ